MFTKELIKKVKKISYEAGFDDFGITDLENFEFYSLKLEEFIKKNPAKFVNLNQGEFSIHHINTVHGSGINNSDEHRVGFAIRYVASDTEHLGVKQDKAIHICGKKNSFYIEEKRPTKDFDINALTQYKSSMDSTGVFGNKKY